MEDPNSQQWPTNHPQPEVDPAYFEKIKKEMLELLPRIREVAEQPTSEEIWATVGDLRFGHPVTPLMLRYRALKWMAKNPPDPRGEKMCSRPGPYTIYVRRKDLAEALPSSMRNLDRVLAKMREELGIKSHKKITVEQFCFLSGLPEDEIQQNLHAVFQKRWNKIKRKNE